MASEQVSEAIHTWLGFHAINPGDILTLADAFAKESFYFSKPSGNLRTFLQTKEFISPNRPNKYDQPCEGRTLSQHHVLTFVDRSVDETFCLNNLSGHLRTDLQTHLVVLNILE